MSFTNTKITSAQLSDDEIDLRQIAAILGRQKFFIGAVTISAFVLSGIYAFTRKPVWEGSFQIVLESQDNGAGGRLAQLATSNPMLANLAGLGGGVKSSLETEVKILESPSVLKPTYDFVKSSKAAAGVDVNGWNYTDWVNNSLTIKLLKGTSVLNLTYQDTDETLVLPVLKRITETYQDYSGRDRQRGLTQGIKYLEQQLTNLQQQSDKSMRAAQAYALNNGLGIHDGLPTRANRNSPGSSVEVSREAAQNKVNALHQQINAAQNIGGLRLYQAPQLQANAELYSQLQTIEAALKEKSALLTPSDQSIQSLKRQRASLISYINQQTIGLLQGELLTAKAELASLTRPREVVLKHRELMRTAFRDEKLLSEIEAELQGIRLDQARQTDPWELISTPTLLDIPVAPRKTRIMALGFLAGLLLGCGAGLVRDRRSGLVFSENELKALLPGPLLERLSEAAQGQWSITAQLLASGPLAQSNSVALLPVGDLTPEYIELLSEVLRNALGYRELVVSNDLLVCRGCSSQVLVTAPGAAQRTQLKQLREQLSLQGTPVAGWLLIDPKMEA